MSPGLVRAASVAALFLGGLLTGATLFREPEDEKPGRESADRFAAARASLGERIALLEEQSSARAREAAELAHELALARTANALPQHDPTGDEGDRSIRSASFDELLEARTELGDESLGACALIDHELRRRLREDPLILEALLTRFRARPDDDLATLLGSYRHPEVERIAVEMATAGESRESTLQALSVLDRLDRLTPENTSRVIAMLANEVDDEVVAAGLYALPHGPQPPAIRSELTAVIGRAAAHPLADVRARALLVLGMSPSGDEELDVLLAGVEDTEGSVRVTAVAALRSYRGSRVEDVRATLLARVRDDEESVDVRRQAWTTLTNLPLDSLAYEEWSRFRQTIAGLDDSRARPATDDDGR